MENTCIGFPWFQKKDYKKLLGIFVDSHLMPSTYDEWAKVAEEGVDRLIKDGATVEMVTIDPATFSAWCREKGAECRRQSPHCIFPMNLFLANTKIRENGSVLFGVCRSGLQSPLFLSLSYLCR